MAATAAPRIKRIAFPCEVIRREENITAGSKGTTSAFKRDQWGWKGTSTRPYGEDRCASTVVVAWERSGVASMVKTFPGRLESH